MTAVDVATALWLAVAALGLALPVSYAGLPVLGQGAFVAVGAFGTALLGPGGAGWPLGLAVVVSVAVAALTGWLVGLAASRLVGASLALATWGLAWLVYRALVAYPAASGGAQGLVRPAPAHLVSPSLGVDLVLTPGAHVALAGTAVVVVALGLVRMGRGPGGLDLTGLRGGPAVAASLGIPVPARRRAVLAVSAALGGLSGAGTVLLLGVVAPADVSPLLSLQLLVAVLLGGTARWWGPLVGVGVLSLLPAAADALARATSLDAGHARGVLTAALLVAVLALRGSVRRRDPAGAPVPAAERGDPATGAGVPAAAPGPVALSASGLCVWFDGLRALDDVDVAFAAGEVHALVGPNGSGKSTLLRVLAGELRPRSGVVEPGSAGVVRTPQRTALLPRVPVAEQVGVGARGGSARSLAVLRHLLATPSSRADGARRRARVAAALGATGLAGRGAERPEGLATGDQRLLQVARAVATGAGVLLLDEPAAGMTAGERRRLAGVLRGLASTGAAVVLVEHDLRLVGEVAARVTVLDAGRVLAVGTPESVRADPLVRAAYLGAG